MSLAPGFDTDLEGSSFMREGIDPGHVDGRRWIFREIETVKKAREGNKHVSRPDMPAYANASSYIKS